MKLVKKLLIGAFIAIVSAAVLRILVPLPVATVFAALFFFLLIQIIHEKFGGGMKAVASWMKIVARTAVAFIAFITMRFLLGQIFHWYPVDAYDDWGKGGGFYGVFWGHEASRHIVVEVVLIAILAWALWGCVRKHLTAKFVTFVLVVVILAGVTFPVWASKWPNTLSDADNSLAQKGLVGTIAPTTHALASGITALASGIIDGSSTARPMQISDGVIDKRGKRIRSFNVLFSKTPGWYVEVYPPNESDGWVSWKKDLLPVSGREEDRLRCRVRFQYPGDPVSKAFKADNLPDFSNVPRNWKVWGPSDCYLHYYVD